MKTTTEAEKAALSLYHTLIRAWNARDAQAFANCFEAQGNTVGFDGSQLDGAEAITQTLGGIFNHHPTAAYVSLVREIRALNVDVVLLRAVVGMVPPGSSTVMPERNAVQSLVARRTDAGWKITLFQNTPAKFDGRPEDAKALTRELQQAHDAHIG